MAGKQWQHHALVSSTWSQQLQHPYARGAWLAVTTPKRDLHLQMWQHFRHAAPFTCVTLVRIMGTYYLNSQNLCLCRWKHISAYYCSGDIGKCTCVPWLWFLYPYFSVLLCVPVICCGYKLWTLLLRQSLQTSEAFLLNLCGDFILCFILGFGGLFVFWGWGGVCGVVQSQIEDLMLWGLSFLCASAHLCVSFCLPSSFLPIHSFLCSVNTRGRHTPWFLMAVKLCSKLFQLVYLSVWRPPHLPECWIHI